MLYLSPFYVIKIPSVNRRCYMDEKLAYAIFGFIIAQVFCVVSLCNCLDKFSNNLDNIKIETSDRYEIKQIGTMARNQFLIDKHTGRVWQHVEDPKTKEDWFHELNKDSINSSNDEEDYEE